jgi:hypothetical protein
MAELFVDLNCLYYITEERTGGVLQTHTSETYFNFKLTLVNSNHIRES